jgi:hypothetical protein
MLTLGVKDLLGDIGADFNSGYHIACTEPELEGKAVVYRVVELFKCISGVCIVTKSSENKASPLRNWRATMKTSSTVNNLINNETDDRMRRNECT